MAPALVEFLQQEVERDGAENQFFAGLLWNL